MDDAQVNDRDGRNLRIHDLAERGQDLPLVKGGGSCWGHHVAPRSSCLTDVNSPCSQRNASE